MNKLKIIIKYNNFKMINENLVKKNCINILKHRNYILIDNTNNILMQDKDNNNIVIFISNTSITIDIMKNYINILNNIDIKHCIIIYNNKITFSSKKIIDVLTDIEIETFSFEQMSFDITKHKYYFPHIKLSTDEKQSFIEKYGTQLPILTKKDPVSRLFNFKKNDIIKVIRKDGYVSYRIVK